MDDIIYMIIKVVICGLSIEICGKYMVRISDLLVKY